MNKAAALAAKRAGGRKGGKRCVAKGFAKMEPERRRQIAIIASKKAAELRTRKAQERRLKNGKN